MKKVFVLSVLALSLLSACNKDSSEPVNGNGTEISYQPEIDKSIRLNNWDISGQKQRFIDSKEIFYDKGGRILKELIYHNSGKVRERRLHKYNAQGLNTESEYYDQTANLKYRYKKTYNKDAKLIQKECYLADNTLESVNKLTYESDGSVLDILYYKGKVEETKRYFYNEKGLVVKVLNLQKDEQTGKFYTDGIQVYDYNDKGLMTLDAFYYGDDATDDSKIEEKKVWSYDDKSVPTSYALYGANNELRVKIVYTAELDQQGNWIRLIGETEQWGNNSPTLIERIITVY